jgi:hypothetical protein
VPCQAGEPDVGIARLRELADKSLLAADDLVQLLEEDTGPGAAISEAEQQITRRQAPSLASKPPGGPPRQAPASATPGLSRVAGYAAGVRNSSAHSVGGSSATRAGAGCSNGNLSARAGLRSLSQMAAGSQRAKNGLAARRESPQRGATAHCLLFGRIRQRSPCGHIYGNW